MMTSAGSPYHPRTTFSMRLSKQCNSQCNCCYAGYVHNTTRVTRRRMKTCKVDLLSAFQRIMSTIESHQLILLVKCNTHKQSQFRFFSSTQQIYETAD